MEERLSLERELDGECQADDDAPFDLVCLSHLRWDFIYQRPQHLLSRCARERRVFFVEEPIIDDGPAQLDVSQREDQLFVVVPHVSSEQTDEYLAVLSQLIDQLFVEQTIQRAVLWYYTPMALGFTRQLQPLAVVYDCMDELSAFAGAPPQLRAYEQELLARANLVFTGGHSLYEAKRTQHPHVYAFPSAVDQAHFAQARSWPSEPADQAGIARPRLGFFGAIDERMDIELLDGLAQARPDWQLVVVGPVVKIDPATLPQHANLHYLGSKPYAELPAYLAGWDVALIPFARNESTRFISPTKTPEYLAAGRPVVSTPIRDVVEPYGVQGLVRIAESVPEFVAAVEAALAEDTAARQPQIDAFLHDISWDRTWASMDQLIESTVAARSAGLDAPVLPTQRLDQRRAERIPVTQPSSKRGSADV